MIKPCLLLMTLALLPVAAYAAPNLSGNWILNVAKSAYGKFPAPQSMTRKVVQEGATLFMTSVQKGAQGEVVSQLSYTVDGKPAVNKSATGESTGTARWIGDKLMVESSREI